VGPRGEEGAEAARGFTINSGGAGGARKGWIVRKNRVRFEYGTGERSRGEGLGWGRTKSGRERQCADQKKTGGKDRRRTLGTEEEARKGGGGRNSASENLF